SFDRGDLRDKLARYHADPHSTFWGWRDIWLHPDFRSWDISEYVTKIQAPVLAIQGYDDQYGTTRQLVRIAELVPHTKLLELAHCRQSHNRYQPEVVSDATTRFVAQLNTPNGKETQSARPSYNKK